MAYNKSCCEIPAVKSDYEATGEVILNEDLPVYTVGPKDAKKAVFVFPDVFGHHPNTKQFCDILANACGYKVVLPDFFVHDPFKMEFAMKEDKTEMRAWAQRVGTFPVVEPAVKRVVAQLKEEGVESAALVGFCWGANISVILTQTESFFVGASLIHPSMLEIEHAEKANKPIMNILTHDEPAYTEYLEVLRNKGDSLGVPCEDYRFDDMIHGFCAARGDFTDSKNVERVDEAIKKTIAFFNKCFAARDEGKL